MDIVNSEAGQTRIEGHPNMCPFCHRTITPNALFGHICDTTLEVMFVCPNQYCQRSFIAYYESIPGKTYYRFNQRTTLGNVKSKIFSDTISNISNSFIMIYSQAYAAEQQNLTEICGVGYRKALEFLIKDYIILNKPSEKENVEKKLLGSCIAEYVDDSRINVVAKRAVWLGNDETHYVRKWEGKNLEDLKKLIELTVHWIEMESLTKTFESEMPEK